MPPLPVTVQGSVRDASTGRPAQSGRVCLTREDTLVASTSIGAEGTFGLQASDVTEGEYLLIVLVGGLAGWRGRLEVAGAPVVEDLRVIELRPSELPPGVHGQAWDVLADRPVLAGRMHLWREQTALAVCDLDTDGRFAFDLTCRQPMPPGSYALVPDVPGYAQEPTRVAIIERLTVYQLGRVNLAPAAPEPSRAG